MNHRFFVECPLSVQGISKSFHRKKILDGISFTVKKGEIFGLIGINGAGKTTLIKIMLQLLYPDLGRVTFFGEDAAYAKSRRHIAYLPEKFMPSPFLTGIEFLNLCLGARDKKVELETVMRTAMDLHLDPDALTHRISQYSKGMAQKLGLMSVLLTQAPLLILDEPMSGLDPNARQLFKEQMRLQREQGTTLFFSSHLLNDIEELCQHVAVLHLGKLLYVGTLEEFRARFQNLSLEQAFLKAIS